MSDEWLTMPQVKERLGTTERMIKIMVWNGKIAVKFAPAHSKRTELFDGRVLSGSDVAKLIAEKIAINPPDGSEWMDPDQVAKMIGVSERRVRAMVSSGQLIGRIVKSDGRGDRRLFSVEEVHSLIEDRARRGIGTNKIKS